MAGKYTLGKTERLKSRKKIDALFSSAQRITSVPFLVYYRVHNDSVPSKLQAAFSASKKNFRKAVDRNRAKRILREVYRLQNTDLKNRIQTGMKSLDIFIIYTGKELPVYNEVSVKFEPVLQKLIAVYDKA